ncbi:hypothetical protein R1flu_008788 [Riccia fluitans]|uniref:Uncharacterized protein n=1 Tax=Riccia fluitans TaxID=41844 RepID=A0ABD1XEI6_9MARC
MEGADPEAIWQSIHDVPCAASVDIDPKGEALALMSKPLEIARAEPTWHGKALNSTSEPFVDQNNCQHGRAPPRNDVKYKHRSNDDDSKEHSTETADAQKHKVAAKWAQTIEADVAAKASRTSTGASQIGRMQTGTDNEKPTTKGQITRCGPIDADKKKTKYSTCGDRAEAARANCSRELDRRTASE